MEGQVIDPEEPWVLEVLDLEVVMSWLPEVAALYVACSSCVPRSRPREEEKQPTPVENIER